MSDNAFYEKNSLLENMICHIGETVTVFTSSGGVSGCGFTGVLAAVTPNFIKLITDIGEAPACPIGSNCCGGSFGYNQCNRNNCCCFGNGCRNMCRNRWIGSITEIPICSIVCFTHHAI